MKVVLHLVCWGKGNHFERVKFEPVRNRNGYNKPSGGLWTSPKDAEYGWAKWSRENEFGDLTTRFEAVFSGRVLIIDDEADLAKLPWLSDRPDSWGYKSNDFPDFEQIAANYDAIWLTEDGERATRWSNPSLYGWDCECVLVLNPDCVKEETI